MISSDFIANHSTYFENLMRHRFSYDVSRLLLLRDPPMMLSVSHAELDDAGVDLVMTAGGVTRQVQMKALAKQTTPNSYAIAESLLKTPRGCVVWICYDRDTLEPTGYHLFDAGPQGLDEKALALLPPATKRKKTGKISRKGYHSLRIKDAQHSLAGLKPLAALERLATLLFELKELKDEPVILTAEAD